jgi:hypothetical protein
MSDDPQDLMHLEPSQEEPSQEVGAAGCCSAPRRSSPPGPSVADLHRRCIALEDERRRLACEIAERRGGEAVEGRQLIEREWAVIREIGNFLERMQTTPARTIDDVAALVDLALDIEFDASSPDLLLQERPWTLRLLRALRGLAPDVEISWLRRQSTRAVDLVAEVFAPVPGGE